jgi:hypothetical protein
MKPADDGLIAHIKESLTGYEETYAPGAWERFGKKERKRRGLLWLGSLSSAAAVLLIGFMLFYTANKTPDKKVELPVSSLPEVDTRADAGRTITENLNTRVTENEAVVAQRANNKVINSPLIVVTQQPEIIKQQAVSKSGDVVPDANPNPIVIAGKKDAVAAVADSAVIARTPDKTAPPRSFQEFLNAEVKSNAAVAKVNSAIKKNNKWEMGVVVAPSIGNGKKLNMGYGVSMAYALSDKVSISSGVSYSEMGASKDLTANTNIQDSPAGAMAMVSETKSLQSVDASLVGIDIPVEIKYYFTKKFYTNVGLSAFAVLNQKQNNNYLQGKVENRVAEQANQTGFNAVFRQTNISESVPSSEIRDDKYLGFYNISFGYKQKISDKRALSVEPFMKLPMKEFSKENLNLIGTGIRLKFDF